MLLLCAATCLALLAGCAKSTIVSDVWRDSARSRTKPGKTLVLAVFQDPGVRISLEDEWTRQLRSRGIAADAVHTVFAGPPPDRERLVELVKAGGFDTLLICKLLEVKKVERDVSASQVAVVETILYDTKTEQPYWSARSETFLVNPTGEHVANPRSELIREFVEDVIREMSVSKVL
ncbi:MAG: hypothetical protein ACM3SU_05640 [Acidobacteriota bacterium]